MKQVFLTSDGRVVLEDVPAPVCPDGGVLVESIASVISTGTEVGVIKTSKSSGIIDNLQSRSKLVVKGVRKLVQDGVRKTWRAVESMSAPVGTTGYSLAGRVVAVGSDCGGIAVGDLVACAGAGYASHAEAVAIPKNLVVPVPEGVEPEQAAFATIGSIAMQGVRRASLGLGETVVVIGLGLIGQLAVQLASAAGAKVIGVEPEPARRDLSLSLGAASAYEPGEQALSAVQRMTGGHGADAVIIAAASSSSDPINLAMSICRKRGRVVLLGAVGLNVDRADFYRKEIDLLMSTSYGPGRYDTDYEERGRDYPYGYVRWTERRNLAAFLDLLAEKRVRTEPLVSAVYGIDDAASAFNRLAKGDPETIGVLLDFGPEKGAKSEKFGSKSKETAPRFSFVRGSSVNVALIGAGGFGQSVYLPTIADYPAARLKTIVTARGHNAKRLARLYHAESASTRLEDVLEDRSVEAVVIATRHNLHEEMAKAALEAGKHVLLEKPMALTREGVEAVSRSAREAGRIFTVGHNRRYAPTARKLSDLMDFRIGPAVVSFRVNAGKVPADHWQHQRHEGGGRIVGEVCHFIDFLQFLVRRPPRLLCASCVPVDGRTVHQQDNVTMTFSFPDGSLGNILYTSLGHTKLPKERVEVFWDDKVAVLDDFRSLFIYGSSQPGMEGELAKGWKEQFDLFIRSIRGENTDLLKIEDARRAALLSLDVRDRIAGVSGDGA